MYKFLHKINVYKKPNEMFLNLQVISMLHATRAEKQISGHF